MSDQSQRRLSNLLTGATSKSLILLPLVLLATYAVPLGLRLVGVGDPVTWALGEDGIYETFSAVCCLAASLTFLYTFLALPGSEASGLFRSRRSPWLLLLAVMLFLLFGEEISWGQRIFSIETPPWLQVVNDADELNLHNLALGKLGASTETLGGINNLAWLLAYAVVAGWLGVLPLVARIWPACQRLLAWLDVPIPSLAVALALDVVVVAYLCTGHLLLEQEAGELIEIAIESLFLVFALETYAARRPPHPSHHDRRLAAVLMVGVIPLGALLAYYGIRDREPLIIHRVHLAMAAVETGQFEESIAHLEEALSIRPRDVRVLTSLASVELQRGNLEDAARQFEEVTQIAPRNVDAHFMLAVVLFRLGQLDRAADAAERALELAPFKVDAHTLLGVVRMQQGRLDEAARRFDAALRLDPENREAKKYRAAISSQM